VLFGLTFFFTVGVGIFRAAYKGISKYTKGEPLRVVKFCFVFAGDQT
jgi:hypothetical protein